MSPSLTGPFVHPAAMMYAQGDADAVERLAVVTVVSYLQTLPHLRPQIILC
ncbi:MAG: hypothetical protein H6656_18285 [Ardenticatenaceae bacterium]|nr:hypothetical protein [Ardenticatenaceae bacterium]